jgi:hypothetical protein
MSNTVPSCGDPIARSTAAENPEVTDTETDMDREADTDNGHVKTAIDNHVTNTHHPPF